MTLPGEHMERMQPDADRLPAFSRERPHLLGVAFRILGSEADAEDVVQEAWIRYARTPLADIENVPAWLTTVVTRLCLDHLRRSRRRPQGVAEVTEAGVAEASGAQGPEEIALLAGDLTEAMAIVLDELTPPQRVAFILHEVFGTSFDEVAAVLGTTPGSAKKLASRARGRMRRTPHAPAVDPGTADRVVRAFLRAVQLGDLDGLVAVLHPDVIRTADPHVLGPGGAQRLRGADAVVAESRLFRAVARHARVVTINGHPGIAVPSDAGVRIALVFRLEGERVAHYDVIADPGRLALLNIED